MTIKTNIIELLDFERINTLLEGFNKTTGFVTAILDLEGNVLSRSGWRSICTDFHRVNQLTAMNCTISDTELAGKMATGKKYHFYKCLNGLVDVAVPVIIHGEHIANLFSGQFFFEEPDVEYFFRQAIKYGFDEKKYLEKLREVPVLSEEKVKPAMDFLLMMTEMIAHMTMQRMEQVELNNALQEKQLLQELQNRQLKEAKEKAEASDAMYSSILQTSMDGFCLLDTQFRFLQVNDAYLQMIGYSEQELLKMGIPDVEANESPEEIEAHVQTIMSQGYDRFVTKQRRKDGSVFEAEVTAQYKPIDKGQMVIFIRDISERIKDKEEIEKSERNLRLFVEHSPASIAMFDQQMRYIVYSKRFLQDYNLPDMDLTGRSHYEVFPEISEQWKALHSRGLSGETIRESRDPFPRADGAIDWVRWEILPWYEIAGQIGGIILFSEVITRQVEAEMELRESEKYNRMLFEQSEIGLALVTMDGVLVDYNSAFATIIGRTVEEAQRLSYWDITPTKYMEQEHLQLDIIIATGKYGPYEKEFIHSDGHLVPVRLQGSILERNGVQYIWSSIEDITERKKAEIALIAAKEAIEASEKAKSDLLYKLNEAQHSAKIGNWEWDMSTNRVWWSDEIYNIFDVNPEEYIPSVEANAEFIHPDDVITYHLAMQNAIDTNQQLNIDLRINSGAGTLKYCHSKANLKFDEAVNAVVMIGTFANITERKIVEQSLQQSEDRLNKIFRSSPSAIIVSRISDGRFLDLNDAASKIYGYKREEIIGHTSLEFNIIDPKDRKELVTALKINGSLQNCEVTVHSRNEGDRRVLYSMEILTIDGEQCMLTSMIDITDRKRTEEALARSEMEFRTLAESMPQIVWITRTDGANIYFNQQWVDYTGLSMEESYGDGWIIPFHPDDKERAWKAWDNAVNNIGKYSVECRLRNKDGSYRWFLIRGIPVMDDKGQIVKWFGTCTDIEEIKEAENQIQEQLDELRRWHDVTLDREDRILELKSEVNDLLRLNGQSLRYGIGFDN